MARTFTGPVNIRGETRRLSPQFRTAKIAPVKFDKEALSISPEPIPIPVEEPKEQPPTEEPRVDGRQMTVADLTPEQKAEYDKVDQEARENLKPIEAELITKKERWQELYKKAMSTFIADVEGKPAQYTGLTEDESREHTELGDTIHELQGQYDNMARAYTEKRLAIAGVTRAYTGPTITESKKSYEQYTELAKGGETAFNYAKNNKLIPADAIYVDQGSGKWAYTTPAQQREQINALVTAGVLTTEDLRGLDLNTDISSKLQLAVDTYNKKQFQNTINDLVTQGVLDTAALRDIGDDPAKIQPYVDKYNANVDAENAKIEADQTKWEVDLKKADAEGYKVFKASGYDAYAADVERRNKETAATVIIPEAKQPVPGAAKYENEAELRAYGQELASTNPGLFKTYKEAFASGNWGAFEQAVQTYNDQIDAEDKKFKTVNTQLADGSWLSNKDLADIKTDSPKLYDAVLNQGYDKTFGYIDSIKESNPKLYVAALQKYGLLPEGTEYLDTLPDGTVRVVDKSAPDYGPKTVGELAKKIGIEAAGALVPGVWARNLKVEKQPDGTFTSNMPAWEIGLNAGLDLMILIPVAGWGVKAVGKAILKSGTMTIEKSLAKELPKALVKAGERGLANEAKVIAKSIPKIQKTAAAMEKTAVQSVKVAAQTTNPKVLAKAYQAEQKAKATFVTTFQTFGNDLAELNSKITYTSVKGVGKEGLSKTVGLSKQAPDFAEYITGSAKDLARAEMQSKYFAKTTPSGGAAAAKKIDQAIKAYQETPRTVGEVAKASGIALTKGKVAAAAYLRGETGTAIKKGLTPTDLAGMPKKQADKILGELQSRLAKDGAAGRTRAEKYLGKQTTLDKWDEFIKDSWHPKSPYQAGVPSIWGEPRGGISTITKVGGGGTRAAEKVLPKAGDEMALSGLAGKALFRIITKPDGTTVIVPSPDTVKSPSKVRQIPVVPARQPGKTPTTTPSKTPVRVPSTRPGEIPVKSPAKVPSKVPAEIPAISPAKVPSITPSKVSEKTPTITPEKTPSEVPVKIPARIPERIPAKVPEPTPERTPVKTPAKTPVKVPVKIPVKTPARLIPRFSLDMTDAEKREAIKASGGAFTWRQGTLNKKPVRHVVVNPFRPQDKTTVLGKSVAGALDVTGKGQAARSITLTRGEAPARPVRFEGGAVDPEVSPTGKPRGVRIDFRRDPTVKRSHSGLQQRIKPSRLHSKKVGRIFRTRIGNGSVLSRRPLGRKNRR